MALWNIYVRKSGYGEEWGNTYHVDASGIDSAVEALDRLVTFEKSLHYSGVSFIQGRVTDTSEATDLFASIPLSGVGDGALSGDPLPILLTLNVAIIPDEFGSPSRKYYHTGAGEGVQNAGDWASGVVSGVLGAFAGIITEMATAGTPLVDPDGSPWNTPIVRVKVGRHKFSRASRRITPP